MKPVCFLFLSRILPVRLSSDCDVLVAKTRDQIGGQSVIWDRTKHWCSRWRPVISGMSKITEVIFQPVTHFIDM